MAAPDSAADADSVLKDSSADGAEKDEDGAGAGDDGAIESDRHQTDAEGGSSSGEESDATAAGEGIPGFTTERVNLRDGAGQNYNVIRVLDADTALSILSVEGEWTRISLGGEEGYIFSEYIAEGEVSAAVPDAPPDVDTSLAGTSFSGAGHVVVIDPGHQASGDSTQEPNGPGSSVMKARVTGGTRGRTTGVYEYELALAISLQLRDELQARGYTVYMTREAHDVNISNMERAQFATEVGGDIAVRIHANGVEDSGVSGALSMAPSTANPYCANIAGASQTLARCVIDAYCEATGMRNQGVSISDTMSGMNWSTIPVTILEMGYMTNPTDDTNMEDAAYQRQMVEGIANGIDRYFMQE